MKELRLHRKEFAKNIRMGHRQEVITTIKKYGIGLTSEEGATAPMLALHHNQQELVAEMLRSNASIRQTDPNAWLPVDYLLEGFYKNVLLKHQQVTTVQTLRQYWYAVKPPGIVMELFNHQLYIGGNSMLFFLIVAMRTMQASQSYKLKVTWPGDKKKESIVGAFGMDDLGKLVALVPDEILPAYRKNRSYINSVLSSNEQGRREQAGCKPVFERVERGR